ncbi:hypothetical protein BO443_210076 [Burkholderia orbicola]
MQALARRVIWSLAVFSRQLAETLDVIRILQIIGRTSIGVCSARRVRPPCQPRAEVAPAHRATGARDRGCLA